VSNTVTSKTPYNDYEDFDHTGPDTLMGRWLRLFWHPVLRSEDVPVGWPKPVRLMNEDFTVYRGVSGQIYVTEPKCPHRRTQLSIGWVEGETISCRFHGWKFDGATGQCVGQPAEPKPFCQNVKLRTYPVKEYCGLIFIYVGEGDAPPFPRYESLEAPDAVLQVYVNYHDYNYFANRENDPLHAPFTHRTISGGAFDGLGAVGVVKSEETPWGYSGHVEMADGTRMTLQYGMPLINNIPGGAAVGADAEMGVWTEHVSWKLPVDDTHGMQLLIFAAHVPPENRERYIQRQAEKQAKQAAAAAARKRPSIRETAEAVLAGKIRIDDIGPDDVDPPGLGLVMVQDWITQAGQGIIQEDRRKEKLGASDATVVMNRRLLRRELLALKEGRPLKQWSYDDGACAIAPKGAGAVTAELKRVEPAAVDAVGTGA
jgi:5,5'-dehydrodivanillate O-demethylase